MCKKSEKSTNLPIYVIIQNNVSEWEHQILGGVYSLHIKPQTLQICFTPPMFMFSKCDKWMLKFSSQKEGSMTAKKG